MADMGPIIGIDLGTTFSSIDFLNAFGRAEVIPTVEGAKSIPSVVLFPERGPPVVGLEAKERSVEAQRLIEGKASTDTRARTAAPESAITVERLGPVRVMITSVPEVS